MLLLSKKKIITIFLLYTVGLADFNKICSSPRTHEAYISDFNLRRDREDLRRIFEKDKRELTDDGSFSSEYMMQKRKPGKDVPCIGSLHIKTLRVGRQLAGFTAYYMETPTKGIVLLLAVEDRFRGNGYGKILVQYAMNSLISKRAECIGIWVSHDNLPAKRIYKELGFTEKLLRDDGNLYLEYYP